MYYANFLRTSNPFDLHWSERNFALYFLFIYILNLFSTKYFLPQAFLHPKKYKIWIKNFLYCKKFWNPTRNPKNPMVEFVSCFRDILSTVTTEPNCIIRILIFTFLLKFPEIEFSKSSLVQLPEKCENHYINSSNIDIYELLTQ